MAKIRGCLALALTYINVLGTIALLTLLCTCLSEIDDKNDEYFYYNSRKLAQLDNYHPNLRGTKLKLIEIKAKIEEEIYKNQKIEKLQDFNEEEFVLPKKEISNISFNKKLRKLDDYDDYKLKKDEIFYAIGVDTLGIFFTFVLMFSFCLDKNECCDRNSQDDLGWCCLYCFVCCDCHCNCSSKDCDCKGGNGNDGAVALLVLLIVIIVFVGIFYAITACGKHLSRYISITVEVVVDLAIMILISMFDDLETDACKSKFSVIYTICGILALCNLLSLIIPNLSFGEYFRYGYNPNGGSSNLVVENPSTPMVVKTSVPLEPQQINPPPSSTTYNPPPAYPQNAPLYPVQEVPNYPQANYGYNNGQGGIYNAPPSGYPPNPQPQPMYGNIPYPQ